MNIPKNSKRKAPSFQFYPNDWLTDIELRACSTAARGLWIDLMCLMHCSGKYGYLTLNDKNMDDETAAKLSGNPLETYIKLKNELISKGVARIDENGNLFSKRMVEDEKLREKRRNAGKLGGNPNLKPKDNQEVNQEDIQEDNNEDKLHSKQKLTPSSSSSSPSSSPFSSSNNIYIARFEEIWKQYPNKDGKKAAKRHFLASVKTDKDWEDIQKALKNYLNCKRVKDGYIKNGSNWFNNWRDWVYFKEPKSEDEEKLAEYMRQREERKRQKEDN